MEILVKATDQASGVLKDVGKATEGLETKARGLSATMQGALGALSAYAGSQGLKALINASEGASMQISQARFFLAGFGGDVSANLAQIQKWAIGMQKAGIAGDEYATIVASKLAPRVKSLTKAQEYAAVLLRGERLGIMGAQEAATMMMRASDGNERALRMLLEQVGIAVPEFSSLANMMAIYGKRLDEAEKSMSPFAVAMRQLKENIGEFAERAGAPLAAFFAKFIGGLNFLLEKFPVLSDVIAGAVAVIATALTGLGIGMGLSSLLSLLGLSTAFGPWGLAIGAAIGGVVFYLAQLENMSEDTKRKWQMVMTGLAAAAAIAAVAINAVFFLPLAALFAALAVITSMSIEGYELSWKGFKDYMRDTFVGIGIIIKESFGAALEWIKDQFTQFGTWISNKVSEIMTAVSNAISAVSRLPGVSSVVGAAKSAVSAVTGKKAAGGPVNAGASYLVGERGPEIFTPRTAGAIIPNGGGGGILVDMRGSTFLDRQAAVEIGNEIIMRLRELHRLST
jgi:hypothetical protein